jgi:hypothetical protein
MRSIVAPTRDQVRRVLLIGRDHSTLRGGRGLSLRQLIEESGYRALRPRLRASQLEALIESEPALVDDWLAYSEDKRTSHGWGFGTAPAGGWLVDGPEGAREVFASRVAACAEFVLRELDFWAAIGSRG